MEKEEYFNQRIDCDVKECKFHAREDKHCTLGKILVSGKQNKENTFCNSFEKSE